MKIWPLTDGIYHVDTSHILRWAKPTKRGETTNQNYTRFVQPSLIWDQWLVGMTHHWYHYSHLWGDHFFQHCRALPKNAESDRGTKDMRPKRTNFRPRKSWRRRFAKVFTPLAQLDRGRGSCSRRSRPLKWYKEIWRSALPQRCGHCMAQDIVHFMGKREEVGRI